MEFLDLNEGLKCRKRSKNYLFFDQETLEAKFFDHFEQKYENNFFK